MIYLKPRMRSLSVTCCGHCRNITATIPGFSAAPHLSGFKPATAVGAFDLTRLLRGSASNEMGFATAERAWEQIFFFDHATAPCLFRATAAGGPTAWSKFTVCRLAAPTFHLRNRLRVHHFFAARFGDRRVPQVGQMRSAKSKHSSTAFIERPRAPAASLIRS